MSHGKRNRDNNTTNDYAKVAQIAPIRCLLLRVTVLFVYLFVIMFPHFVSCDPPDIASRVHFSYFFRWMGLNVIASRLARRIQTKHSIHSVAVKESTDCIVLTYLNQDLLFSLSFVWFEKKKTFCVAMDVVASIKITYNYKWISIAQRLRFQWNFLSILRLLPNRIRSRLRRTLTDNTLAAHGCNRIYMLPERLAVSL